MTHVAPDVLLRPLTGSRLHLSQCYRLERGATVLVVANEADLEAWQVCSTCQAELGGHGRQYFDNLERALEAYVPLQARQKVRNLARDVDYDAVWAPNSRSYIALGSDGTAVAYVGKTYWRSGGALTELPGYDSGAGGGPAAAGARQGRECPTCNVLMPVAGGCGTCD